MKIAVRAFVVVGVAAMIITQSPWVALSFAVLGALFYYSGLFPREGW